MLSTTVPSQAMSEFAEVRAQQVANNNAQLAAPSNSTGSLSISGGVSNQLTPSVQANLNTLARRLSREHAAHTRIVVTQARPAMHMRVVHYVAGCTMQMAATFGPVSLALLAGTFGIVFMMFAVGIVLGVRELVRYRRAAAGYAPLDCEAKDAEVVFDAEQYNHHVMTEHTTMTTPPPYP